MHVDINLLPKKEKRNTRASLLLVIFLLAILFASIWMFFLGKSQEEKIGALDRQITTTQELIQIEQNKVLEEGSSSSIDMLETAVLWTETERLKAGPFIRHVTGLLPDRGFIESVVYSSAGEITLEVRFDTSRDSAFYLKNLLDSDWFAAVLLDEVGTFEVSDGLSSESDKTEVLLPRYLAVYTLSLDKDFISNQQAEAETTSPEEEEGSS